MEMGEGGGGVLHWRDGGSNGGDWTGFDWQERGRYGGRIVVQWTGRLSLWL